jgi:hypothetical protein
LLDAVFSPFDHGDARAFTVWGAHDCTSAAWSAYLGDDAADKRTPAQALRAVTEVFFNIFGCCCGNGCDFVHALLGIPLPDVLRRVAVKGGVDFNGQS